MPCLKTTFLSLLAFTAIAFAELGDSTVVPRNSTSPSSCAEGTLISAISFEGLEHTKPRVVERELLNRVGEPFSAEKFEAEKRRLQDLDLFTEITVSCNANLNSSDSPREDSLSSFVSRLSYVTYSFKEIFRWIPSPAGKETDRDGLMIGLALANLNVLGEDIRAEVQYRTSTDPFLKNNEYAFYVSSPYLFGFPLGWNFEFLRTDSYDDIHGYQDDSWLVDLDLDYEMLPHLSLLGTVAGRVLKEAAFLPEFGLGFAFDFRDSKLDTRRGVYYEYMLTHVGAGNNQDSGCDVSDGENCEGMGGENYWELLTDARAYWTLSRFVTGATALARYRPGDVKFYDYYYHGGPNTFRGRGGSALGGKEDGADSVRLGVHEVLLTLEERFVLMERHAASVMGVNFFYGVQLVAGFDGSLLWDSGRPGWDDYEGAVYGGLHLVIPALDRIRFEVGYRPDRGEPAFYFGLFDKVTSSRWRSR
ncbi:BamA/TamA family outer membrane protein [uncultured Fibrobacter sp.]|uniref:BamA/TamA family outer membrane protein n=1 Tax=uncultured Fibrobacter sp. TaxID=261512 RepID=UPI0026151230|nr:BamA/TamA family outer membrane protein [uncultured Fibrobacter sp.]